MGTRACGGGTGCSMMANEGGDDNVGVDDDQTSRLRG
jgi:hypothetical protein